MDCPKTPSFRRARNRQDQLGPIETAAGQLWLKGDRGVSLLVFRAAAYGLFLVPAGAVAVQPEAVGERAGPLAVQPAPAELPRAPDPETTAAVSPASTPEVLAVLPSGTPVY